MIAKEFFELFFAEQEGKLFWTPAENLAVLIDINV